MLLRLAYLGVTSAFALLRLLPMSDPDEAVEILALRHQVSVLERQLGHARPRFSPTDRAFLAALLHRVPMKAPEQDVEALDRVHTALAARDLLPAEHLVDTGYPTPQAIHNAAAVHGIGMVGPVREDPRAKEHPGFTKDDFTIDWETCRLRRR